MEGWSRTAIPDPRLIVDRAGRVAEQNADRSNAELVRLLRPTTREPRAAAGCQSASSIAPGRQCSAPASVATPRLRAAALATLLPC
jgi:hypothetical protein